MLMSEEGQQLSFGVCSGTSLPSTPESPIKSISNKIQAQELDSS